MLHHVLDYRVQENIFISITKNGSICLATVLLKLYNADSGAENYASMVSTNAKSWFKNDSLS